MKLYATTTSERGKTVEKTANEYINIDFTVHRQPIGSIELYLIQDTATGDETDEWLLKYYKDEDSDPDIIAQGNLAPISNKRELKAKAL